MLELKVNVDKEISLRMFEIHDANELFELVKSSKDYLCQWLPWAQNFNSVEEAVKFINFTLEEFKKIMNISWR
ncbi:hypothetical protein P5F75_17640 [Caldifermentibacillus hisashii]|uniref:hypothetical protein n=1 Tax=Caldifermentibacillus hisashii TaxID=996558 RepID=UPI002E1C3AB4|nr:hypothetical protein [Caldifermentibacillus hisashii]